ncbi:hypothetical protein B0H67DRAFT_649771 [Lasiosphaeris hirsuta]|uniref:C2H2-type domain-containing protein n=1 Tax=Lasiosphaeris hirsuta TaxID=260670 RepID=A0AA40DLA1_9PEZI|nr:hypothetical protein B0H67DRAFT_649771 [Lasiosphaeris hirsuta]
MTPSPSEAATCRSPFVEDPPGQGYADSLGRFNARHGERTRPQHHDPANSVELDFWRSQFDSLPGSPQPQDPAVNSDEPAKQLPAVELEGELRRLKRGRQPDKSELPRLACPYYRMNARKYHECSGYVLRRVKDIKQHIYRRHMKPEIYCIRCYRPFSTEECRVKHSRGARACRVRDDPHAECISDKQRKDLHQYLSRGKPVEEQWIDMWRIIFPGRSPPKSVYLDNHQKGPMQLLRNVWRARGQQIMAQAFHNSASPDLQALRDTFTQPTAYPGQDDIPHSKLVAPHLVDQIMNSFFALVEAEMLETEDSESDTIHSFSQPPQPAQPQSRGSGSIKPLTSRKVESPKPSGGKLQDPESEADRDWQSLIQTTGWPSDDFHLADLDFNQFASLEQLNIPSSYQ